MAAGRGKRCEACYWFARCEANGKQLIELLSSPIVRNAFQKYLQWAIGNVAHPQLVRALPRHILFFQRLDQLDEQDWTADLMLRTFGTAELRRFELPVQWMKMSGILTITPIEKSTSVEMDRSRALVDLAASGSPARKLLQDFYAQLDARVKAGKMQPKSMRLALRPAVSLLAQADPEWKRMPDQLAVENLLTATPGQRAALSTFLGFLRLRHGLLLTSTAIRSGRKTLRSAFLGEQLAALVKEQQRPPEFEARWINLALAYFHKLSLTHVKSLLKKGKVASKDDGYELTIGPNVYWIPTPPNAASSWPVNKNEVKGNF